MYYLNDLGKTAKQLARQAAAQVRRQTPKAQRAPHWFDEYYYRNANPDVADAIAAGTFTSGWDHYQKTGQAEGRLPKAQAQSIRAQAAPGWFDETYYVSQYPDIADAIAAGTVKSGWEHYKNYGKSEGRFASAAAAYKASAHKPKKIHTKPARADHQKAAVEASEITGGGFTETLTDQTQTGQAGPAQDIYAPQVPGQYPPLAPMTTPMYPQPVQQGGPSALYPFGSPGAGAQMGPQMGPPPQMQMQPMSYPQAQAQDQVAQADSDSVEATNTDSQEEAEAQPQVQDQSQQEVSSEDADMEAGLTGLADLGKAKRAKCQPSYGFPTVAAYRRACAKARKAQGVRWNQKQCACIDQYGRITDASQLLPGQPGAYPPGSCPAGYSVDPATGQCVPIQPGQSCPAGYMLAMTPTGPQCQPLQQNPQPPYYGGGSFGPVSYGSGPQFDDPYGMAPGLPAVTGAQYGPAFPLYSGSQPGGGAGPMFTSEALEVSGSGDGDIGLPSDYVPYTGGAGPSLPSTEDGSVAAGEDVSGDSPDSMSGLGFVPKGGWRGENWNPVTGAYPVISRKRFLRRNYASLYPAAQGVDLYPISGSNPLYPAAQGTEFYPDSEATGLDAGLGNLSGLAELYPAAQGTDLYPISGTNPLYPAAQGIDFYPDSEACGLNPGLGAAMPGEESGLIGMLITGGMLYGLFKVFCKNS